MASTETVIPSTFVTYAEFIWQRLEEGYKQYEVAEMLGWSRGAVSNYALLNEINKSAWTLIATTVDNLVASFTEQAVAVNATGVALTENLLRDILPLSPDQQFELVRDLATEKIKKNR